MALLHSGEVAGCVLAGTGEHSRPPTCRAWTRRRGRGCPWPCPEEQFAEDTGARRRRGPRRAHAIGQSVRLPAADRRRIVVLPRMGAG